MIWNINNVKNIIFFGHLYDCGNELGVHFAGFDFFKPSLQAKTQHLFRLMTNNKLLIICLLCCCLSKFVGLNPFNFRKVLFMLVIIYFILYFDRISRGWRSDIWLSPHFTQTKFIEGLNLDIWIFFSSDSAILILNQRSENQWFSCNQCGCKSKQIYREL